jgi:site-specific DNA-cytosine methylase
MRKPLILDLCGGTGAWSRPYKEAGYDVQLITLPAYDVAQVEFDQYSIEFKELLSPNPYSTTCVLYEDLCGILAAPPCTEFSVAKGARPRDLSFGMAPVKSCMRIIWEVQKHTALDFWALENPRGLLRRFLGIPHYTFEQWQFGGNKCKATDIWGYFKKPTPTVKEFPSDPGDDDRTRTHAADWTLCDYPPEYVDYMNQFKGDAKRAAARAITPAGFAKAFFRANRPRNRERSNNAERS